MKNKLTLILIGLAIADLLGAIDATGVNIALPTITRDLAIPINISQWVPNAYTLVLVSALIFMGKIGDMIGTKKLYIWGLVIFGFTSLVLGFVNNIYLLICLRAIQGLGTAILYTMPASIIAHLWKDREKAFAVTASFFAFGMLIGPLIGGILTGINISWFHGWHLIFLLNIPFVIFGLFVAARNIPEMVPDKKEKLDYLSLLFLFGGLIVIVLSLTMINKLFIILGFFMLFLLYLYERKIKNPLLDLSLFKNQTFAAANLFSFFSMVTIIGMSFVLTFYLQDILGWSSMKAGLAFLPIPIVTGIVAALSGKIKNWRLGAIISSMLILIGIFLLTGVNTNSSYLLSIFPGIALIAAGSGILMTVIFAAIMGSAPVEKSGMASGFLNTLQQLGSLIGIALVANIVFKFQNAFWILVFVAFAGFISALFVKRREILYEI